MENSNKTRSRRTMKVSRLSRVAPETSRVLLIDILEFIEKKATPTQLRAMEIAIFGRNTGAPAPGNLALANIERFILTANTGELKRIESVTAERRAV